MTGKEWDNLESDKKRIIEILKKWNGRDRLSKEFIFETVDFILRDFARTEEETEKENTIEGFLRLLYRYTFDSDVIKDVYIEADDKQCKFFAYCVLLYHIEIRRYGRENRFQLSLVKYNDKQIEAHIKLFNGEISKGEFRRQENEARYPTLSDKKQLLENRMEHGVEMDNDRVKEILRGYENAPAEYKILRAAVYESVGKTRMDTADIEKILDEKVKELLKAGKINVKTYRIIRKITHKQQRQQLEQ